MAENLSRVTGKPLLPTDWYPMNKKRRHAPTTNPISTQQTLANPIANEFAHHILSATGSSSSKDAAESVKNNVDEFIYIIGDAGQRMLIAGMTSLKHSAEDIAVAFQNYWFSDVVEGEYALRCDEGVVSKAFKSIEDGTKNTWFFGKFSKGGGGYEEALALLEVGICCAYGEVDAVEGKYALEGEDALESGIAVEGEDAVETEAGVKGDYALEGEDVVEVEVAVKGEAAVEVEDAVKGEDSMGGE